MTLQFWKTIQEQQKGHNSFSIIVCYCHLPCNTCTHTGTNTHSNIIFTILWTNATKCTKSHSNYEWCELRAALCTVLYTLTFFQRFCLVCLREASQNPVDSTHFISNCLIFRIGRCCGVAQQTHHRIINIFISNEECTHSPFESKMRWWNPEIERKWWTIINENERSKQHRKW